MWSLKSFIIVGGSLEFYVGSVNRGDGSQAEVSYL